MSINIPDPNPNTPHVMFISGFVDITTGIAKLVVRKSHEAVPPNPQRTSTLTFAITKGESFGPLIAPDLESLGDDLKHALSTLR